MDYGGSYQNYSGMAASSSSSSMMSETEFQRLSQTVGTNIQKMIQNGEANHESTKFCRVPFRSSTKLPFCYAISAQFSPALSELYRQTNSQIEVKVTYRVIHLVVKPRFS